MKKFSLKMLALAAIIICNTLVVSAQTHQLVKLWETSPVFKVPESVLFDAKNKTLYISNIDTINGSDPWTKDGRGSIGKMSADGKSVTAEWVKGLEAPKGMGLYNGKLYVADLAGIVVIDVASGKIDKTITVAGSQGLNDISIDKSGVIYVSDSKIRKIYKVKDGVSELYIDSLKGPNGVLARGNDFYLVDNGGLYKRNADKSLTTITTGMEGGCDGVENVTGDDFIVSTWGGVVYYVSANGTKETLMDGRPTKTNSADIGFDAATKTVFVPTFWKNTVAAYQVK
ncbi:MAG: ATP/GTP-binding protein [Chitinophagaceae bacterium]